MHCLLISVYYRILLFDLDERFEDAVVVARIAAELDPSNREIGIVVRRAHAVASARSKGNELFKAFKYGEACNAYGEGLDHDPQNSVILCNRAACRSKLGHWEKAIKDCNVALNVRPSYSKARLRRADCNAKVRKLVSLDALECLNTLSFSQNKEKKYMNWWLCNMSF